MGGEKIFVIYAIFIKGYGRGVIVITFRSRYLIITGPGQTTIRDKANVVSQQASSYRTCICHQKYRGDNYHH